jgi:hypothetical protein
MRATIDRVDESRPAPRRSRLWLAVVGVAVAAVVGGGIALGLVLTQGTNQTLSPSQSSELASVQTACQRWLSASPGQPGTGQWCSEMAGWMSQEIEHDGIGPQMMWGDPTSFQSACEQWMTTSPPSGAPTNAQSWCDSMVSWMSANVGNWTGRNSWGNWMRYGPMMGQFGP